ncbi:hypothetical protein MXB_4886, partial [Myxobolus squamalis]
FNVILALDASFNLTLPCVWCLTTEKNEHDPKSMCCRFRNGIIKVGEISVNRNNYYDVIFTFDRFLEKIIMT